MNQKPAMNRHRPIIRLFVSSTFSDLIQERNALQARVWPELERRCLMRGFQFQAIDLRWGVPTEAGLDHRTMRICFDELRRAQEISPQPNFLIARSSCAKEELASISASMRVGRVRRSSPQRTLSSFSSFVIKAARERLPAASRGASSALAIWESTKSLV